MCGLHSLSFCRCSYLCTGKRRYLACINNSCMAWIGAFPSAEGGLRCVGFPSGDGGTQVWLKPTFPVPAQALPGVYLQLLLGSSAGEAALQPFCHSFRVLMELSLTWFLSKSCYEVSFFVPWGRTEMLLNAVIHVLRKAGEILFLTSQCHWALSMAWQTARQNSANVHMLSHGTKQ